MGSSQQAPASSLSRLLRGWASQVLAQSQVEGDPIFEQTAKLSRLLKDWDHVGNDISGQEDNDPSGEDSAGVLMIQERIVPAGLDLLGAITELYSVCAAADRPALRHYAPTHDRQSTKRSLEAALGKDAMVQKPSSGARKSALRAAASKFACVARNRPAWRACSSPRCCLCSAAPALCPAGGVPGGGPGGGLCGGPGGDRPHFVLASVAGLATSGMPILPAEPALPMFDSTVEHGVSNVGSGSDDGTDAGTDAGSSAAKVVREYITLLNSRVPSQLTAIHNAWKNLLTFREKILINMQLKVGERPYLLVSPFSFEMLAQFPPPVTWVAVPQARWGKRQCWPWVNTDALRIVWVLVSNGLYIKEVSSRSPKVVQTTGWAVREFSLYEVKTIGEGLDISEQAVDMELVRAHWLSMVCTRGVPCRRDRLTAVALTSDPLPPDRDPNP